MVTRARRHGQRGAAVFVVVMVITLLTAIGLFAARSASQVSVASGFERQSMQTQYLTGLAGRATATEIGSGSGPVYVQKIAQGTDTCLSNRFITAPLVVGAPIPCYKLYMSELDGRVAQNFSTMSLLAAQTALAPGSLGPSTGISGAATALEGAFVVEMTDPADSLPKPGSDAGGGQNGFRDVQVTLTAYGQIRNFNASTAANNPWCAASGSAASASVQGVRAHVTIENIPR